MLVYCDASALVKLFVKEEVSQALRSFLGRECVLSSSELVRVEVLRTLRRRGDRRDEERAAAYLDSLALIRLDAATLDRATRLGPATLRTLDAIHLATALALSPLPRAFLCYDRRLGAAARIHGLEVVAPGFDEVHEP
ncbi:MAG: type II toxin-antitoxin system VapC family toxin [Thermoanaerobaculia bacterium]|jgi:predicted nucleic acid-binding protein|nr:type II toxin-antitoxin system VapC family toxin [Thermoanaerobaculia bacterium]MBP9822651.1 type II toxin-antitoxin system VapC family toxin [Thermoanaerobaculia bacterium]